MALLGRKKLLFTGERIALSVLIFLFSFHINLPFTSEYSDYGRAFAFAILLLIVFFPVDILVQILRYFIKFHIFICFWSVIVFFLAAITELPHLQIKNATAILQETDHYYRLYGFIVSSTNTVYNIGGFSIGRICGIYPEPGHFATYIGFLIIAQKLLFNRVSKIFFVAGALTFSPVFYISLLLLIGYNVAVKKDAKSIRNYFIYTTLLFVVLFFIGDVFRDQLWELAFGRNLTGGIESRLDERADRLALSHYESFIKTPEVWVGKGVTYVEELGIFSDFRGFIFKYGILGLVLSLSITLFLIYNSKSFPYITLLFPFAFLIYFQRSWMFGSIYVYMMYFILLMYFRYVNASQKLQNFENG